MSDDVKGREHLVRRQQALTAVFKRFQPHFQRAFAPAMWPALVTAWLDEDGMRDVDTDLFEQAARDVLRAQPTYPPKVWDLIRAANRLRTNHGGSVQGPGSAVRSRIWEWQSPVTGRFSRAERFDSGQWVWHGIDDAEAFYGYGDDARVEYCEAMCTAHPLPERLMWRAVQGAA